MSGQLRTQYDKAAFKRIKRMNCQNNHEFHESDCRDKGTWPKLECKVVEATVDDYIPLESESCEPLLAQLPRYLAPISVLDTGLSPEESCSTGKNSDDKTDDSKEFIPSLMDHTSDGVSTSKEFDIASLKPSHFNEKMMKVKLPKSLHSSNLDSKEAVKPMKYPIYLNDITRGEESMEIPIVNEYGDLELPNFLYIKKNMVHKDAHVDFSLARISDDNCCAQCYGDCLSSALPCACAGETRGEFAYTTEGLVKEEFLEECIALSRKPERKYFYYCEICPLLNDLQRRKGRRIKPCKGHLTRKFIKECWSKCGCSKRCRNRVVQKGIQVALQVFATPEGKGWGVRSVNSLKKGTFVCEYIGEIVTNQELYDRNTERAVTQEKHTYPVLLDADWGSERILKDEEALCLDATEFGNIGRFVNHRCCDPNLLEIPVEVETPDHHYYHLAFFTSKDIKPMEELTWDYGIEFEDKNHPIKAFNCKCGSKSCRDRINVAPI